MEELTLDFARSERALPLLHAVFLSKVDYLYAPAGTTKWASRWPYRSLCQMRWNRSQFPAKLPGLLLRARKIPARLALAWHLLTTK